MLLKALNFVDGLSSFTKWAAFVLADIIILVVALYLAYALRYGVIYPAEQIKSVVVLFPIMIIALIVYLWSLGIPQIKLQSFDLRAVQRIALCSLLLTLTAMSLSFLLQFAAPRSVPLIFGVLFFSGSFIARLLGVLLHETLRGLASPQAVTLIYGAGEAGIQLASALRYSREVRAVAFIDDNKIKQKRIIYGLKIFPSEKIESIVKRKKVEHILIAMPSVPMLEKENVIQKIKHLPCKIQVMPSHVDIIHGKSVLDNFVPVAPEDLLGRHQLDFSLDALNAPYEGKCILISGAGGSIGLELCRQILKHSPAKVVLYERSEFALYKAERDLKAYAEDIGVAIVPVLGSVCDENMLSHVFETHKVQVVFHAAAYKHVPLVECNEVSALENNFLGTYRIAKQALESKVETFVLVSTDKAVRPTNIMGASKRLAELVVQDFDTRSEMTKFSMVRFGNVLGSSGSVIPLFKEQIAKGGPVTVTHQNVTRYFMAISEAAHLVIVAGSFATGGEVFVLDMGDPVKIQDLARNLIKKSNLTVRDADNPGGDIEIITTGLRPGEKLYEELLIDAETLATPHPKIMRAKEGQLSSKDIAKVIKAGERAISKNDAPQVRKLITQWVEGYHIPSP